MYEHERHMIIMIPHQNLKEKKTNEVNEIAIKLMTVSYLIKEYVIPVPSTVSIQQ